MKVCYDTFVASHWCDGLNTQGQMIFQARLRSDKTQKQMVRWKEEAEEWHLVENVMDIKVSMQNY